MIRKLLTCACAVLTAIVSFSQDIILTKDAKKIEAKILEVSKNEITYKEFDYPNGPIFILDVEDINSIIYGNGKVVLYNQPKEDKRTEVQSNHIVGNNIESSRASDVKELNLARVNNYGGVYVFTDCSPICEYDILGDIYFDKEGKQHAGTFMYYNAQSKSINTAGYTYSETPQYTDIRDALIAQAVMANRQVEGIILSLPKAGEGRATLIKFKEGNNKDLAKVNEHLGVFVFTDCMPLNNYSFVGKIDKAGGLNEDYSAIRDRLIKKSQKKFPEVQGVITRLVSGGNDTAEAIKF